MTDIKSRLEDYTASEFTKVIQQLMEASGNSSYQDRLLENFITVTDHPESSDLIYSSQCPATLSAKDVLERVIEWRASQSLPGFKPE
ncbi:bacteriocin immunity protein [Pseudomonas wadenswilerensis]